MFFTHPKLLFNIIAEPGRWPGYHRHHQLTSPLTRQLIAATVPRMIIGAIIRDRLDDRSSDHNEHTKHPTSAH